MDALLEYIDLFIKIACLHIKILDIRGLAA